MGLRTTKQVISSAHYNQLIQYSGQPTLYAFFSSLSTGLLPMAYLTSPTHQTSAL